MILEILRYGHPALRSKGRRIETIDPKLEKLARDMLETMRDADGIGLAAQQIGRPLQLCVVDVTGVTDRPSWMRIDGKPAEIEAHMPLVLINPEIEPLHQNEDDEGHAESGSEGCLSFPGISADIPRPVAVRVRARKLDGSDFTFEAGGLLARAVQHEHDHLHGILFIDRMDAEDRAELAEEINKLARYSLRPGETSFEV